MSKSKEFIKQWLVITDDVPGSFLPQPPKRFCKTLTEAKEVVLFREKEFVGIKSVIQSKMIENPDFEYDTSLSAFLKRIYK